MKDIWYATSETGSFGPQRGHNTLVENHCSNTRPFLRLLIDWTIKVASYMSSRYYFSFCHLCSSQCFLSSAVGPKMNPDTFILKTNTPIFIYYIDIFIVEIFIHIKQMKAYVLVTVIKCHERKELIEEGVYFGLWFQRHGCKW